jgi:hypothetical protein
MPVEQNPNEDLLKIDQAENIENNKQENLVDLASSERGLRSNRDSALNEFRKNKLLGSFNTDYQNLRTNCKENDSKFDATYGAYFDYLMKLQSAMREGKPLKSVKEPSLSILDSSTATFLRKTSANGAQLIKSGILWWSIPGFMAAEVIGSLWDTKEFMHVRKLLLLTEKQRVRVMNKLNREIEQTVTELSNRDATIKDKDDEIKARKKDEAAAAEIRKGLGL